MIQALENRFYYLDNFQMVLDWIAARYGDLLTADEQLFIAQFSALPKPSSALLVRMVMRKGDLFRSSKLCYEEIGSSEQAAAPLRALAWIDGAPPLTLEQLFALVTKPEIAIIFALPRHLAQAKKADQLAALAAGEHGAALPPHSQTQRFGDWYPAAPDVVYQLRIGELCERFRLLFFGNLHQDWTEFVLADLGIFQYEKVAFSPSSRAFRSRADLEYCLRLHACRQRFEQGEPVDTLWPDVPAAVTDNPWLDGRRDKLLFRFAQYYERNQDWPNALKIYADCGHQEARVRRIRVLERSGQSEAAFALAQMAQKQAIGDAELQQLARMLPRIARRLGHPASVKPKAVAIPKITLRLAKPQQPIAVECLARDHLAQGAEDAPSQIFYVENALINALFGLLCWKAIFAALPGAFFHPFQRGPADLSSPDFYRRRKTAFDALLAQLDGDLYRQTIRQNFHDKAGLQSPFVAWSMLDPPLLELALLCLPGSHLKKCFQRILHDIPGNRCGLPDLIQFWPQQKRYRMIEVKGPGDRLQDNQIRWLDYCIAHQLPVAVCYVDYV